MTAMTANTHITPRIATLASAGRFDQAQRSASRKGGTVAEDLEAHLLLRPLCDGRFGAQGDGRTLLRFELLQEFFALDEQRIHLVAGERSLERLAEVEQGYEGEGHDRGNPDGGGPTSWSDDSQQAAP